MFLTVLMIMYSSSIEDDIFFKVTGELQQNEQSSVCDKCCYTFHTDIKDDLSFIYMNIGLLPLLTRLMTCTIAQSIQGGSNWQSVFYLYFEDWPLPLQTHCMCENWTLPYLTKNSSLC